jgi:two-component system, cell cycle response regulator
MTAPRKTFSVASMGLEERERFLLRGVATVSKQRSPSFEPFVKQEGTWPDIVLVNGDDDRTMRSWEAHAPTLGKKAAAIVLSADPARAAGQRFGLTRPVGGRQLLATLERAAMEFHGYVPALAFDTDDTPPVAVPAAPSATPVPATAPRATAPGRSGIRALVVDDSLPVRIQMKQALQSLAEHVDFAEDGEQAMQLLDSGRYDIAFLDVVLPGDLSGYQICKAMKGRQEHRNTPVIMLTSNSSPADRIKGKLAGCDTYLIKPVKQGVFEEVVRAFLTDTAAV